MSERSDSGTAARIGRAVEHCARLPQARWREELEQLLDAESDVRQALDLLTQAEQPTRAPVAGAGAVAEPQWPEIPGFRILGLLGVGGMGRVYLAQQRSPDRRVALKLIRADLVSDEARLRMEREANLLARLDHPAIARVLAAGSAVNAHGEACPWLAMSLIEGSGLNAYLEQQPLDDRDRVRLLLRIAEGVEYAHRQGVIHRDLKPSNVMVDRDGAPHILDFGVARLTEVDAGTEITLQDSGALIGTLGYMAPEQIDGEADTRCDVYALGVMLYRMLTGRLPIELDGLGLKAAMDRIAERAPTPLRRYRPDLGRDLEAVVMQALDGSPARRYGSVGALIDDLNRYLEHRPVLARPASTSRRALMFVRRHRFGVSVASVLLLSVLAATVVSVHFGLREAEARSQAEARSEQLLAVNRFIQDMLVSADPDNALGREVTVGDALSEAALILPVDRSLAPGVRAELHRVIGSTLLNLGRTDEGRVQLEQSVDLYASLDGSDPEAELRARMEFERAHLEAGRLDEALAGIRAIDARASESGVGPLIRSELSAVLGRAMLETGLHDETVEFARVRLQEAESALGPDHVQTLVLRNLLAAAVGRAGDRQGEADIYRELVELRAERFGNDHPQTLSARNNLATAYSNIGRRDEAETLGRAVLADRERVLGPDHPSTVISRNNLAALLIQRGALDEAEPMVRSVLEAHEARLGPLHPNTLTAKNILAYLLEDRGQLETAEGLYRGILRDVEASGSEGLRLQTLTVSNNLGMLLSRQGRHAEAVELFERLLEESRVLQGETHPGHALFIGNLGRVLLENGQPDAAAVALRQSLEVLTPVLGADHPRTVLLAEALARCGVSGDRTDASSP